ncbi:MAG: hypothetical protein RLP02_20620, partial [Coleofasciculus sp. C2-GNP5-27]
FVQLKGTKPLAAALQVSGPYEVDQAPNAYSFERSNDINIDWEKVLDAVGIPIPDTNASQFKLYIERAWQTASPPPQAVIDNNVFDLLQDWPAFVHSSASVYNAKPTGNDHPTLFQTSLKDHRVIPVAATEMAIESGCVFRVPTKNGDRWYQPVIDTPAGPQYPTAAMFAAADWSAKWDEITALVQVYYPGSRPVDLAEADTKKAEAIAAAKSVFPAIDIIRADAATIHRQYQALMNDKSLGDALSGKADEIALSIPSSPVDVIPTLTAQYRELKNFQIDLDS